MKRILSLALVLVLMFSLTVPASAAATGNVDITYRSIRIVINGEEISPCDENGGRVEPFIMDATGTTYLPLRAVAGALGLSVEWDAVSSTVKLTSGAEPVSSSEKPLYSNSKQTVAITYRDIKVTLDGRLLEFKNANGDTVEPFVLNTNSSTYLPLRAIGEALGLEVSWDAAASTAALDSPAEQWLLSKSHIRCEHYGEYGLIHEEIGEYDSSARLVSRTVLTNGLTELAESYSYHPNGAVSEYRAESSDGSSEYSLFDEKGNCTRSEVKGADGELWTLTAQYSYEGEVCTAAVTENGESRTDTITEQYDEQGRLAKSVRVYGGSYEGASLTVEYSYDSCGNYTGYVSHGPGDITGSLSLTYDADGRLLEESFADDRGGYSYTYTYGDDGRLSSVTRTDDFDFYEKAVLSCSYDSHGNLISASGQLQSDIGNGSGLRTETWEYTCIPAK